MNIIQNKTKCEGIKFSVKDDNDQEIGRAYLYIMYNNLHKEPFGFLEDIFVEESVRGGGVGSELVRQVIEKAKAIGCYKFIANSRHSRPNVHKLYEKFGFEKYGIEFRLEF